MNKLNVIIAVLLIFTFFSTCKKDPKILGSTSEFTLYVSNQSFEIDTVDINIYFDGNEYINEDFYVGNQHNWKEFNFKLSKGRHNIEIKSLKGLAVFKDKFMLKKNKYWAILNYWYAPLSSTDTTRHFNFTISDQPIYLQ